MGACRVQKEMERKGVREGERVIVICEERKIEIGRNKGREGEGREGKSNLQLRGKHLVYTRTNT